LSREVEFIAALPILLGAEAVSGSRTIIFGRLFYFHTGHWLTGEDTEMESVWDLIMLLVLSALAFVVSGAFLGLSQRVLSPVLIGALAAVIIRMMFIHTNGVIMLSLAAALVLSTRLLVGRRLP
jgi:hypothetical protein